MDRKTMQIQPTNGANIPGRWNPSNEIQRREERPMMLNTWTQTSNTDLGISEDFSLNAYIEEARQRERELLQKICELEEKVREQSETILTQTESLSRHNKNSYSINSRLHKQQVSAIIVNPSSLQRHRRDIPYTPTALQNHKEQSSSMSTNSWSPIPDQQNSNQEHRQQSITPPSENFNSSLPEQTPKSTKNLNTHQMSYTIIADGAVYGQEEPIEIQVSEEVGDISLNCSAQSERLEICLSESNRAEENENNINCAPNNQINQSNQPTGGVETPSVNARNFELYKASQYSPAQGISYEEPTSSKHCRALLSINNRNSPNKFRKIKKERKSKSPKIAKIDPMKKEYTTMGPNNTLIDVSVFEHITWDNPSTATRKLLSSLFSREVLATHSMTGRPSPAFKNKPAKDMLDQKKIEDIIYVVSRRCQVSEKDVRTVITTKCADENKMWRLAQEKSKALEEKNKENIA